MTPSPGADLALRDIHLPPAIDGWPPAPGWWLLALLLIVSALALLGWLKRPPRRKPLKAARAALKTLDADFQVHHDSQRLAQALSTLLRRTAISLFPREQVAGLTGDAWLAWLDEVAKLSPQDGFQAGPGRSLRDAQYRATQDCAAQNRATQNRTESDHGDGVALLALADTWLTRVGKGRSRSA